MRLSAFVSIVVMLILLTIPAFQATAQESVLGDLLPTAGEIGPEFLVIDNRTRSLDEQATGFANVAEAAGLLAGWHWQENSFQHFETDDLTEAGAPVEKVDISLTRFESAEDAAAAMPYFLEDRAAILGQREFSSASGGTIGDESRGINGFYNGYYDVTIYARSGPLLLRVSTASASGSPDASPEEIAREIVGRGADLWQSAPGETTLGFAEYLPETLALQATDCAWSDDGSDLDLPTFIERYDGVSDAAATLGELGWQEGAYRQFGCDTPAPGHVGWVTIGVSRFADAQAAAEAVAFFADARAAVTDLQTVPATALGDRAAALAGPTVNGTEYSLYVSDGPLLFRVTGVAPSGDPRQDVETIAANLTSASLSSPPAGVPTQASQPLPPPTGVTTPAPRATMIPTPLPAPTQAPAPTIAPLPTSTPVPTAAPQPTAMPPTIPVTVPTAAPTTAPPPTATAVPTEPAPLPTAPAGSPPTPTPRVIHPPSQVGE